MTYQQLQISDIVVVLVEPSSTQQKIIGKQLNEVGIRQIIYQSSGEDTLRNLSVNQPDVVISALYLPDMTGTELVHRMRDTEDHQHTAFILISSETRFRYLDPIRQAGAIAILPKPFSKDALQVAMTNALDYIDPEQLDLDTFSPEDLAVLIVDDSKMARQHIMRVLSSLGIEQFHEACDGVEALQLLSDHYFDLVVTDYNMPNMDGKELIEHIRHDSQQASVPVIMVTSEENENRLAAVQKSGVSAICDKPFENKSVKALVQQLLA